MMIQHYKLHFKYVPILTKIRLVYNDVDQNNAPLIQRPVEAIVNHEPADPNDSWVRTFSIAMRQHYKLHFKCIPILTEIRLVYNSIDQNDVTLNTETMVCFVCCRLALREPSLKRHKTFNSPLLMSYLRAELERKEGARI